MFERNESLCIQLEKKLRDLAGKENVKLKKIDRLHDSFKELATKYSVNKREFYENLSLNDARGSFVGSTRG